MKSCSQRRKGVILVLAALLLVMIMAFTAFTVDLGYLSLSKAQMQNAADAAALQRALAQLPATTRSVLWLYHAEGHTHEEIAALMQRTTSFSKSQLARGTRRLRALLSAPAGLRSALLTKEVLDPPVAMSPRRR